MILTESATSECGLKMTEAVDSFEEKVTEAGIHLHGYMILAGRRMIREQYFAPYNKTSLHRMYSVTKSFVAMAAGLLIKEGKIRLEDKICDFFPEYTADTQIHPWCRRMTIEDMLTMRSCYCSTTSRRYPSDDWTKSFFRVEPDHIPGTVFAYDTSASNTLTALIEKLTGKKLLDYLRDNCLREIGFSEEAYIIPDPVGVSQGGSGMMCTLRDMACAAYLCNHFGWVDDKELLSEEFMRRATSNIVPTDMQSVQDERNGYGYFFWMPRKEGFCMYGMGGQLALCFPKKDFCLLTMGDTIGNPSGLQVLYDCFYHFIYPLLEDRPDKNPLAFVERKMENNIRDVDVMRRCAQGRVYRFYENTLGLNALHIFPQRTAKNPEKEQEMYLEGMKGGWRIGFGMGFWKEGNLPISGRVCLCRGDWKTGHLIVQVYAMGEEQGHLCMDIAFAGKELSIRIAGAGEYLFEGLNGFASAKEIEG